MVRFTESTKPKPGDSKLDRIEIWRNEVAASRLCCTCSAPTVQAGPRRSSSPSRLPTTSNLYKNIAKLAGPLSLDRDEGNPFFSFTASGSEQGGSLRPSERTSHNCSVCASPIDGVAYKWLSSDGSGLVLARNSPPRLLSSLKSRETGEPATEGQAQWMGKLLWERVSQLFRHTNGEEPPQSCEPSESTSIQRQRADTGALNTPITMIRSRNEALLRRNGTEMYHNLRDRTGLGGTADNDGEDEMISTVSDDEGKRPTLGIDKSAARLRRAQRLLNKDI
ncbi:hypothetical protein F5B18DRAFT_41735 [Nemania serpens]|nr:hypothetical protein F5B18DRAFT_41735 [Nemania serpens]